MRKRRPWFMLLLALTSGVVAALLALRYLRERTTPLMAAEPKRANIVLTARSLPVGAVLTERDLKPRQLFATFGALGKMSRRGRLRAVEGVHEFFG